MLWLRPQTSLLTPLSEAVCTPNLRQHARTSFLIFDGMNIRVAMRRDTTRFLHRVSARPVDTLAATILTLAYNCSVQEL